MATTNDTVRPGLDIAVIGMTGRFPGACHIKEFWENLKQGIESISFFSQDKLKQRKKKVENRNSQTKRMEIST